MAILSKLFNTKQPKGQHSLRLFSLVSVYDDCNNITEIYKNNALIRKYTYDDLQQMTREIIIEPGATTGKQYDFEYDLYGNILSKTESTYTVATGAITGSATAQFSYTDSTWKDLLTSCGNMSFTYDEIGNLRSLKNGSNTSGYYFNWGKGRQLESLAFGETGESAEVYVEYGYNADGIRISRTFNVGGLEYIVDGDKILKQLGCGVGVLQTLEFYYDALGEIIGFNYANQDYYFGKNLQGDVVDLIPFVTGVGEATRGIRIANGACEAIDTAGDITKVGKKAPVIIGENMKRVRKYAKEIGGHAYQPWKNVPFDYNLAMKRNTRWINDMMAEGREIIDIGPDFARRRTGVAPSDFYNMERSQVKGFAKYTKAFTRKGIYGGVWGEW